MSYDIVVAGVGGQPIDRFVELIAAACAQAGEAFLSTAPRGVHLLGGTRLAQVSVGPCFSSIVTEDTGEALVALEAGEGLRYAKFCARDGGRGPSYTRARCTSSTVSANPAMRTR